MNIVDNQAVIRFLPHAASQWQQAQATSSFQNSAACWHKIILCCAFNNANCLCGFLMLSNPDPTEQTTSATDLILAVAALCCAAQVWRWKQADQERKRLWAALFCSL